MSDTAALPDPGPLAPALTGVEARLRDAVRDGLPAAFADLGRLVRIPSVSWDGFDPAEVARSADAVHALLEATGAFDEVRVARATVPATGQPGQPAVLARRAPRNGRPTILLYAHHDVQPPGADERWQSPPFEPTLRGDRLYGRGAADDKAGVMAHVAAIRALVEVLGPDLELGLAVFIEGEEEAGSESFPAFLEEHRDMLAADAIVVADSGNWDTATPALTVSLRGNVGFHVTVSTLDHALHSGMFGGPLPDAMLATIRLLDTLWDEDGAVAVAGLDSRQAPTPEFDEARLREESGLLDGVAPIGRGDLLSRIWNGPAITVTGIDAPDLVNASNTLQPSVTVRLSARLSPGQDTADALAAIERHLHAHAPFGARVEIGDVSPGQGYLVDDGGPFVAAELAALADAFGVEPVRMGVGGSIPFIADLVRVFPGAEILVTGVEDPDSRAHSPNESLHVPSFAKAVLAEALLLLRSADRVVD